MGVSKPHGHIGEFQRADVISKMLGEIGTRSYTQLILPFTRLL